MKKISITHVTHYHNDWIRGLDFYKQEIEILKKRLTEIAGKNTDKEVMKQVEHFENLFKIKLDNIDNLYHDINLNVKGIAIAAATEKAGYIDNDLQMNHNELKLKYREEEKIINELRQEFMRFSAGWM